MMIIRSYCHTELVKRGQKYADSNIQKLRGKGSNNFLLNESDVMQGGGYAVSISLVVQTMAAQVWQRDHVLNIIITLASTLLCSSILIISCCWRSEILY